MLLRKFSLALSTNLLLTPFFLPTAVAAQEVPTDPGQKIIHMVRTDTPPVIDGDLSDSVWAHAAKIDDLHQMSPVEYAAPTEYTEIYILYDDDALYIGARLHDSEPDRIAANGLRQNEGAIGGDDTFWVTIDPFNEQRSGYYFGLNANGVRSDGLYRNITEFYPPWDSIYRAKAGRFEGGWTVEIEIPFKSISLDPDTDTWGLNFSRYVQRKSEIMAWVSRNQLYDPSASGLAVGFEGLKQGLGLDVVPSMTLRRSQTYGPDGAKEMYYEPQVDIFYKLTPQLNAALTLNTDFSATEVDDRQVNLNRFALFFPEKRDFFLREADIFEFGRIGGRRLSSIPGLEAVSQNGRPFFSRRIGLSPQGTPIDIEAGAKLSGRIDRVDLGAMSVRQDSQDGIPAETFSVLRAKTSTGRDSSLGFILTEGNPGADIGNSLWGVDYQYHNTRLPGGKTLDVDLWYQRSDTEGVTGDDSAFGAGLRLPSNTGFRGSLEYKEYGADFNPALGFVNRRDISDTAASIGYMLRMSEGYLQSWLINLDMRNIDYLSHGGLQTHARYFQPLVLRNQSADQFTLGYQTLKEGLVRPFEIAPGITIPSGHYAMRNWRAQLDTGRHRKLAATLRHVAYDKGSFFGGDRSDNFAQLIWSPSPHFRSQVSYSHADIRLPQGGFETHLARMGLDLVFSSKLSWVNLIQYDNVTETAGINSRLHWIPEAGREFFFVINHSAEDFNQDDRFRSLYTDISAKFSYTFRM